jgi:hypothetical protein
MIHQSNIVKLVATHPHQFAEAGKINYCVLTQAEVRSRRLFGGGRLATSGRWHLVIAESAPGLRVRELILVLGFRYLNMLVPRVGGQNGLLFVSHLFELVVIWPVEDLVPVPVQKATLRTARRWIVVVQRARRRTRTRSN